MENTEHRPLTQPANGLIITGAENLTPLGLSKIMECIAHDSVFPRISEFEALTEIVKHNAMPLVLVHGGERSVILHALFRSLYPHGRPCPDIRTLSEVLEDIRVSRWENRTGREQGLDQEVDFWLVWSPQGQHPPRYQHTSQANAEREAVRLAAAHPGKQFYVVEPRYEVTSLLTRIRHERPLIGDGIPF